MCACIYVCLYICIYVACRYQSAKLGPGRYDLHDGAFSAKSVAERAAGPGWSRAYEVARVAALPHLLFKEQWEAQRLLVGLNYLSFPLDTIFTRTSNLI